MRYYSKYFKTKITKTFQILYKKYFMSVYFTVFGMMCRGIYEGLKITL